jgi:hypothetical protein
VDDTPEVLRTVLRGHLGRSRQHAHPGRLGPPGVKLAGRVPMKTLRRQASFFTKPIRFGTVHDESFM